MVTAAAQVTDSTATDSSAIFNPVTSDTAIIQSIQLPEEEKKVVKRVSIWRLPDDPFERTVTNDSLLRWQIWPGWGDFYAYRRDALTYRRGTIGRTDAFTIRGYDSYEQQVWLDEISVNDPVTGLVNYNLIPHHKIGIVKESYTGNLNSYISTKNYYIIKPISYLNYDESSNDYRNLEFMISQNTSPGTNVEVSYWDRREGGFYPNNEVDGSQIFGKLYHHLGDKYQLQAMILRNQYDNDEPGGYVVGNPAFFQFDEFGSTPNSISGASEKLRTDIKVGIYQRADTLSAQQGGFLITRSGNEQTTRIFSDTLRWSLKTHTARLFRDISMGRLKLSGDLQATRTSNSDTTTIRRTSWNSLQAKAELTLKVSSLLSIKAGGHVVNRSDQRKGNGWYSGLHLKSTGGFKGEIGFAAQQRIPTIQSLYWKSDNYSGDTGLFNEEITSVYGSVQKNWDRFSFGIHSRLIREEPVLLSSDSIFVNGGSFEILNGGLFARMETPSIEVESSATGEYTLEQNTTPEVAKWAFRDTKLLIRNSFFYKWYAFDRAAFLKLGVRTLWSPFITESQFFNAEVNYWQFNSSELGIPAFFRLDAELSARVRRIMVVMRWENALDGLGQAGYFEAAGYPMMPRRLLVGIRAQFRN